MIGARGSALKQLSNLNFVMRATTSNMIAAELLKMSNSDVLPLYLYLTSKRDETPDAGRDLSSSLLKQSSSLNVLPHQILTFPS